MPVYKDEQRGTWYARISTQDPVTGKRTEKKRRGFRTRREAVAWEAEQRTGPFSGPCGLTFRQLDDLFIEYKSPRKASTRAQERFRVDHYCGAFADLPVQKITKQILLSWFLDFQAMPVSVSVKNHVIGVVRSALRFGHEVYGLPDESSVLRKIRKEQKREEMATWTPAQFATFLEAVPAGPYREFFRFLYWTGCRRGEALALRRADFDEQAHTVHIWHQIKNFSAGFMPLKTDTSDRVLSLPDALWAHLGPLVAQCTDDRPFVFGGDRSLAITSVARQWAAGIAASGVPAIRLHDLRHSFATNAIGSGANIVAVSKYMGHATIQQKLATYTHLLQTADRDLVQKIGSMMD